MKSWLSTRNTYVDYGMRFVVISEKDEVLRISHAVMSELFDRRLALPQYARKRIRWCEVVVSLKEGRAVAVQRFLAMLTEVRARAQGAEVALKRANADAKEAEKHRREAEERFEKAYAATEEAGQRAGH